VQIQCAKLENSSEIAKQNGRKSVEIPIFCDFPAKYLHNSKNSRTFAALFKKSPAKSGFVSAKSKLSAFDLHCPCSRF
jgi:hypothetical protein